MLTFGVASGLVSASFVVPALAAPASNPGASVTDFGGVTPVYDGCGPYGRCRPGGQAGGCVGGASCPARYPFGPRGRRGVPN